MEWINSGGGPLICGEEHISAHWMGVHGLSANSGTTRRNDYERACSILEYLGDVTCDIGRVLVLGDEPLQSSFFRSEHGNFAIARWVYAHQSSDVEKYLQAIVDENSELAPAISFEVTRGTLVLFDSALRGADAFAHCAKSYLEPGSYRVTTEKRQLEKKFNFIVHRLLKGAR